MLFITLILLIFLSDAKCNSTMALSPDQYKIEKAPLHVPTLEEVAEVFRSYLPTNFAESEVEVVDCPDLLQDPFFLAERGLCGNPKIFEIGSTQYLLPLVQREKLYDLKDIAKAANLEPAYFIGAGAGPFPTYKGVNCEGIYNVKFNSTRIIEQLTRVAHVEGPDEHISTKIVPVNETRVALLGNLFGSEGNPGKVIKVHVKKRIGEKNFIETLRNSIEEKYGKEHLVGIGGAFLLVQGKAKHHIMRDFSKTPITDEEGVNNWLKFYNMSAPMIGVGTFVSNDGGALDLRVQHFHSYSTHREAGHYHYDTTPEIVEYLGYFNVAEEVVRVDQPALGHKLGRD